MNKIQLNLHNLVIVTATTLYLGVGLSALAAGVGGEATPAKIAATPAAASKDVHVKKAATLETGKRRQSLVEEAIVANDNILNAISFLEKKDTKQAIKLLEEADGKLNVILARDPKLKLAAIGVRTSIIDLEASTDTIQKIVKEAESALDKGEIQAARVMLSSLTSEMHIYTDYLPLELYPDAIKSASKEIQNSKLKEAEATLADALSSIVTDEEIIPLPPLKAEGDVLGAEVLLNKDKAKNKGDVLSLLHSADNHLANAKALGYGDYKSIRDEIASIRSKVEAGKTTPNIFERIKNFFHGIGHSKKA